MVSKDTREREAVPASPQALVRPARYLDVGSDRSRPVHRGRLVALKPRDGSGATIA